MGIISKLGASTVALAMATTLATAGPADAATSHKKKPARSVQLIESYHAAKACTVLANYPSAGTKQHYKSWKIHKNDIVGWRYNVNHTYAVVSVKKNRKTNHAWWGFVKKSCIGKSVGGEAFPTKKSDYPKGKKIPTAVLSGRSGLTKSHYRAVKFHQTGGTMVNKSQKIYSLGTLRDGPNNFVIGNVFAGYKVQATNIHKSGWTKVYSPNAKRWGWVQDIHFQPKSHSGEGD